MGMNMGDSKLKSLIEEYLSDAELKETIHDPKLDLGFRFVFPKGKTPQGRSIGRPFTVIKAKDKNVLEISSQITISAEHIEKFKAMEKGSKEKFFKNLIKIFLLKEVFYSVDFNHNRYMVVDNIFLSSGEVISKNTFFNSIRKVFGCVMYSITELQDFCSGEFDITDLKFIP